MHAHQVKELLKAANELQAHGGGEAALQEMLAALPKNCMCSFLFSYAVKKQKHDIGLIENVFHELKRAYVCN